MADLNTSTILFVGIVITLAVTGEAINQWAGRGGQKPAVLSAWGVLIAVSLGLLIAGAIPNVLSANIAEAYRLLGLICVIIFGAMTFDILKKLKTAESQKLLAEDL